MNYFDLPTIHALALQAVKGNTAKAIREAVSYIPYEKLQGIGDLKAMLTSTGNELFFPDEKAWNIANDILDRSHAMDIHCLSIASPNYPKYLRAIDDAPNVLHLRGNLEILNNLPGVAVVGSRKTSEKGEIIAQRIASFLVEHNWVVVSGLALGIDAAAHTGSLSVGKPMSTIAVLAHGLETAKPAKNRKLGEEILDNGGIWVSEHPIGTPANRHHFVPRNRIQLGLSVGSVIVEAEEKSGSISQAKFCVKQKRPLFAVVPHAENNPLGLVCAGTELLVRELGAYPLKTKDDYPIMCERLKRQFDLMSVF